MGTPKPKRRRKPVKKRCRTVLDRRTRKRKKVCRPVKRKRRPAKAPVKRAPRPIGPPPVPPAPAPQPNQPVPSAAAPPVTASTPPPAPPASIPQTGVPRQTAFGAREAERLLWRAGFGPRPGEVAAFAKLGAEQAVLRLTRPAGAETFTGPAPVDGNGDPYTRQRAIGEYGGDVVWWFDRMVRSDQPLRQRMALVWHDWFATADRQTIGSRRMLAQHDLFRASWLGNFKRLAHDVTTDEAMLVWLNGIDNERGHPNENYARELMELFALGADRGAYTEDDVRQLARVLTGYHARWISELQDLGDFRFYPERHDPGAKTLWAGKAYARTGAFGWSQVGGRWRCDAVDLVISNPFHPSFFVRKLWSYFVPSDPPLATQRALEKLYVDSGCEVRPVVEAILLHPDLYADRRLVKPPAVFCAGLWRARGRPIAESAVDGVLEQAGQRLFNPPDVAGWRDQAWLDTNTLLGRAEAVRGFLRGRAVPVDAAYPSAETPAQAVDAALGYWDRPAITAATREVLLAFARDAVDDAVLSTADRSRQRAKRQNALRFLVAIAPDHQTC